MKKIYSIPMLIAATAMAFSSCTEKEKEEPVDTTPTPVFIEVKIVDELNTKATVATKDDELFTAAWEDGDEITITYSGAEEGTATATYNAEEDVFEFEVPANVATKKGDWSYTVEYGITGNTRSQEAGEMNGKYDLMSGTATATDAVFARVDNDVLSVEVKRQTALLYFHITALRSAITETVTAATLKATNSNGTTEIALAVNNGPVMNNEDGMVFWFNVPAGEYSALDLEIETPTYVFETTTKVELPATLVAGTLTKTTGAASGNYTMKGGVPALESDQFDCCDYSPYVWGFNVNNNPTIDTVNMKEGTGCYNFNVKSSSSGFVGPIYFKKLDDADPFKLPENTSVNNVKFNFWLYTDKDIQLGGESYLCIELTSSGTSDKEEIQWIYKNSLKAGWNKIDLDGGFRWNQDSMNSDPDFKKGLNFARFYIIGAAADTEYNLKLDDLRISKDPVSKISVFKGNGSLQFRNVHPLFSPDKKHVYLQSLNSILVSITLATGEVDWTYTPELQNTNAGHTMAVNPENGDIYISNRKDRVCAVTKDGQLRWTFRPESGNMNTQGGGLAISSDCKTLFIPVVTSDNRHLEVVDAKTGELLQDYNQDAAGGGGTNLYTYRGMMAIYNQDADYEYIAIEGNEVVSLHKFSKTDRTLSYMKTFIHQVVSLKDSSKKSNCTPTDISAAVVGPDKKHVYFFADGSSERYATVGVLDVTDIENPSFKTTTILENNVLADGAVFDAAGNVYMTIGGTIVKMTEADLINNSKITPLMTASVAAGTSYNACFNFMYPAVTSAGNVYHAAANTTAELNGDLFKIPAGSAGTVVSTKIYESPVATTQYQAVFAVTDGYAVVGVQQPVCVYIYPLEGETIAPKTWGYYGGDPCSTKNANLVY